MQKAPKTKDEKCENTLRNHMKTAKIYVIVKEL